MGNGVVLVFNKSVNFFILHFISILLKLTTSILLKIQTHAKHVFTRSREHTSKEKLGVFETFNSVDKISK